MVGTITQDSLRCLFSGAHNPTEFMKTSTPTYFAYGRSNVQELNIGEASKYCHSRVLKVIDATWTIFRRSKSPVINSAADWIEFCELAKSWHIERGSASSVTAIVMCKSYLRIIAMGKRAIPLIMRRLQQEGDEPDMWFVALQMLTNENPSSASVRGNFKNMAEAWIEWGQRNGYAR